MSNSDIVSAINTLIVAYQYKGGSVDWRLVGQELGVDKDCARMRVQRLLKKWPGTDLDVVEEKIMHSKLAKPLTAQTPVSTPAIPISTSSTSPTHTASTTAGISKPRRESFHYHPSDHQRRLSASHSRSNSLGSNTTSAAMAAAYAPSAYATHLLQASEHSSSYPPPSMRDDSFLRAPQPALKSEHRYAQFGRSSYDSKCPSSQYMSPSTQLLHPDREQAVEVPRVLPYDSRYLHMSASQGMNHMHTLQQAAAVALANDRRSSSSSLASSTTREDPSASPLTTQSKPECDDADDSADEGSVVSAGAAEGAMMLEKMKIDTILV
ncbi:hypothetical protein V1517DRAFT_345474 [Lipomyces orientalis]|uniref:Uncharacterized protein n=1 Tax=Lipomyces orientalis TaxID=1233043 RepID=A0ACC3TQL0_9ASCO